LKKANGKSLVVAGSNNVSEQLLINAINDKLGNYGNTIDFGRVYYQRKGSDAVITQLAKEMKSGRVDAVIFLDDCNPVYDLPPALGFKEALAKVNTKISCSIGFNDTAALCNYSTPRNHYLESWGDANPKRGVYSIVQPTIAPLFDTRQAEASLLKWVGVDVADEMFLYDYVKKTWMDNVFSNQTAFNKPQIFWDNALRDGVVEVSVQKEQVAFNGTTSTAKINKPLGEGVLEVQLYENIMGAGAYADNPWLQEMPDPITRCTWGNYLQVPIKWDGNRSFEGYDGLNDEEIYGVADIVKMTANGTTADFTVVRNFGLKDNTMAVSLGYGRKVLGKAGQDIGTDVFPWVGVDANGHFKYYTEANYDGRVGKDEAIACVQYHHTIGLEGDDDGKRINLDEKAATTIREGFQGSLSKRVVIRRTNLKDLETFIYGQHGHGDDHHGDAHAIGYYEDKKKDGHGNDHSEGGHHGSMNPFAGDYMGLIAEREHHQKLNSYSLYPGHDYVLKQGHHWGMHIDLNSCFGCGACTIACMSENNVPVVGKTEVGRHHEMAWLRIDRYFYGDFENPNVVYQPMMCQHCDNAPCENVCPVAATPHSSEGLNQMAYNRCIGTRYCANNCPYKVRRFNWMDYSTADLFVANEPKVNENEDVPFGADNLTRMVLNPDVTVRSRGVMEKCSFCVQRIQEGKLTAKMEGRRLRDSDTRTACSVACPTGAITFGDLNNPESAVSKAYKGDMNFVVLEQTNVRSAVQYTAKVVNKPDAESLYGAGSTKGYNS
ncbi:MAG: 4Fe-4S dicluster domain-containing protein, partial [Bacteroidota bacterium]